MPYCKLAASLDERNATGADGGEGSRGPNTRYDTVVLWDTD